jgi:hypothetical protein
VIARPVSFGRARLLGLLVLSLGVAASVACLAAFVPVRIAQPVEPPFGPHRVGAALAFGVIAVADALALAWIAHALRRRPAPAAPAGPARAPIALRLTFDHVRPGAVLATAAVSLGILLAATAAALPLWETAGLTLLPWAPVYFAIARWQYGQFGAYAVFGGLALLQTGHLGEHVAQCVQLLLSHGNLRVSKGVFGQLDVETVHFWWNVAALAGTAFLLTRYGARSPWLWISFAAASFHTVEHLYLYWVYLRDHGFYAVGGSNGIFAAGGLCPWAWPGPTSTWSTTTSRSSRS